MEWIIGCGIVWAVLSAVTLVALCVASSKRSAQEREEQDGCK